MLYNFIFIIEIYLKIIDYKKDYTILKDVYSYIISYIHIYIKFYIFQYFLN